ncbi:hypothetical protein ACGH52_01775 [Streptomyces sp. BBFR25]|uniref:hypothetical protein n=1 Tax=Streptomyces sp. BBFR25 TaxID=3372855 RepID=UPI0037DCBF16
MDFSHAVFETALTLEAAAREVRYRQTRCRPMTATVLTMMLCELPQTDPDPASTGTTDGRRITLTTRRPTTPANPEGPDTKRLSASRFDKSLRVVANSVIFRASGQHLTATGTYVGMTARLVEPALLGLAVLAVRSRVKR